MSKNYMRIIVTHDSPDMDAITSVWLIKKFLSGWENATVEFVPAGERYKNIAFKIESVEEDAIEKIGEAKVLQVDTGLGPLDHHQTESDEVSAASLTWDYVKFHSSEFSELSDKITTKIEAIARIVKVVVDIDHFKEVFWENPTADHYEFSLVNILDGLKLQFPNKNDYYVEFISKALDSLLHEFENRIWAEKEIEKAVKFETRFGRAIGFETMNDSAVKLAQKMGFVLAVRKDPRKGYVRIKARPDEAGVKGVNLNLVYEKLKKMDPNATWFLHVSNKMLLNGSVKNPKMRPTSLSLGKIIEVLKNV